MKSNNITNGWMTKPNSNGFWYFKSGECAQPVVCYIEQIRYIGAELGGKPTGELRVKNICGQFISSSTYITGRDSRYIETGFWKKLEEPPSLPTLQQFLNHASIPQTASEITGIWQPIETAPRDETEVLIKTSVGSVTAWFHSEPGECYQWVCYDDRFSIDGDDVRVTHWMPLPTLPSCIEHNI